MMYVSIEEASTLLSVSRRTIHTYISNQKVTSHVIPCLTGGFKREIALESLPQDAQQRYWQQVRIEQEAAASKQSKRGRPSKAEKQAQEAAKAAKQAEIQ
ncbi:hypothetical protein IJT93_12390, partial [bacterium]|nr:hypothetical protein [bacterium]